MSLGRTVLRNTVVATMLFAATVAHGATQWSADATRSRLGFTGTLSGGTFEGTFRRFQPEIAFDAADLPGSRFRVTVQAASADTQDADRDEILKGPEFFAVERWPQATFEAAKFTVVGPGRFSAAGRLTLRDVTRDVMISFTFTPTADGSSATLVGTTSVKRLEFGVGGQGDWRDTQWVGDEVKIRFDLLLRRK